MTTITKNTDVASATIDPVNWNQNGWETCAASAFDVIIYTYNSGAVYSIDSGATFHYIDANGLCARYGKTLSGDQVVIFLPTINQFAWVMLTGVGDQNMVLALASPEEIKDSGGTSWATYLIPPGQFGDGRSLFDRPSVSVGDYFLYIAVNLQQAGTSIAIRLSLEELKERRPVHLIYFVATPGVFFMRPTQNTGFTAYFAALMYVKHDGGQQFVSNIRVFAWPETSDTVSWFDVPIAAVPTQGGTVQTPLRADWLANGRSAVQILGLALSTRNELWAAWSGNRTIPNPPPDIPTLSFPYPHIGIAVIDVSIRQLKSQRYIWNRNHAFVFPDLAADDLGDVGLSFCWGGGQYDPQFGVGILTGTDQSLISMTQGRSSGAGGEYVSIRLSFPEVYRFAAAGFNVMPPGPQNRPHYVIFAS